MAGLLLFGYLFGNRNEDIDSEQTHTVLVIASQVLKQRDYLIDYHGRLYLLDKSRQIGGCLSSHHWRFIMHQSPEILPEALLKCFRSFFVGSSMQSSRRHFGGEPVCSREAKDHGNKMLFDLLLGQL